MPLECVIKGCDRHSVSYGLCNLHRQRWERYKRFDNVMRSRGDGGITTQGYHSVLHNGKRMVSHRVLAEKALGRTLPKGAVIHHVNGIKSDNRPDNLVICPNQRYHFLLHKRQEELWGQKFRKVKH